MSNGFCGNTNVQKTEDRDCLHCLHKVPYLKDDGTWGADCEAWTCEFISREDAKHALKELAEKRSADFEVTSDEILEIKQQMMYFRERANTTDIKEDAIRYSATANGLRLALNILEDTLRGKTNDV